MTLFLEGYLHTIPEDFQEHSLRGKIYMLAVMLIVGRFLLAQSVDSPLADTARAGYGLSAR